MLCDRCKKNEATIHIETIHDGKRVKTNLCSECARREEEQHGALAALGFNLAEALFHSMHDHANAPEKTEKSAPDDGKSCPVCNWTLEKIKSGNGRLGCPHCYETFTELIDEVVGKVQKGRVHVGKRPDAPSGNAGKKLEIRRLQNRLADAVRREEYEEAARCRDEIRRLEKTLAAPRAKSRKENLQ